MPLGNPIRKQNESRIISVLATEGQSVFTVEGGYIINNISVFRNGVRLSNSEDFTAGDGSTVTLNNAANIDDRIEFHVFDRFTVQNAIVGAASSQTISGDLVINGKIFGNLDVPSINTGIVTATQLDLNGSLDVSSTSVFNDDVTFTGASENVTFDKSVDSLIFNDGAKAIFGTSSDMHITHNGTLSQIANGTNQLEIISNDLDLRSSTGDEHYFTARVGGAATVFYDNSVRLETTPSGADVTGTLNVTGISTLQAITATTAAFSGEVSIADKIVHTGDSHTAMRFTGNDTITFDTGGTSRVQITDATTDIGNDVSIADKIIHTGDTNTAIRFPSADTITFETAGTQKLSLGSATVFNEGSADIDFRIESSGTAHMFYLDAGNNRIGLNRTAPLEMFEVGGNIFLTSNSSNANDGNALKFQTKAGGFSTSYGAAIHGLRVNDTSSYLRFDTGGQSEKMRLTEAGRLGIGKQTPSTALHVRSADNVLATFESSDADALIEFYDNSTSDTIVMGALGGDDLLLRCDAGNIVFHVANNNEKARITSGGNVNIGGDYTNTTSTLRVIGDSGAGSQTYLEKNSGSTNNTYNTSLTISSRSTGSAAANYGPAIGFQHSFGSSNYAGCLIASQCNSDVNTADLVFYPRNYGYTEKLRITSAGLIGINNSSPNLGGGGDGIHIASSGAAEIHLTGSQGSAATDGLQIQMNGNIANIINRETGSTRFYIGGANSGDEKLRIDSSGRVRIGADEQGGTLSGLEYRTKISSESGQTYTLILGERGGQGILLACRLDGAGSNTTAIRFADGPGVSSTAAITVSNTTVTYGTGSSDRTMKKNFENWTETVLTKFKNLNPQKFNYKVEEDGTEKTKGYIAQDLVEDFPEAYPKDPETDKYSFNPSGMVVYLMKALQEATTKIETLEAKVSALEGS